jgi:aminomethyltransferase
VAGYGNIIISATGYTGSGGFELYMDNEAATEVWNSLMDAGKGLGLKPAGLGARDTLRLEMGYRLYGNDIDGQTNPIESGLGWITRFSKQFTASTILKMQKEQGTSRQLVGFELTDKGIARHGYDIVFQGDIVGQVTSGTFSPSLKKSIGMGYVPTRLAAEGSEIGIQIRDKVISARVVNVPFYKGEI